MTTPLDLAGLETESSNTRTADLDLLDGEELVRRLHAESAGCVEAVGRILPQLGAAVEEVARRLQRGGRMIYVGAGTSGRLGVLDASECPPTFGVPREMVQGIIAGGSRALTESIEGAEDDPQDGARAIGRVRVRPDDVTVGISASGRAPFVQGALIAARARGAYTIAVVNVRNAALSRYADTTLAAVTGPEPLTGSTRLTAGTAQKLILNLLSTGAMVRLGKVYGNLMVDMQATNSKLRDRASRIVMTVTGVDRITAENCLQQAGGSAKTAIVMLRRSVTAEEAFRLLDAAGGRLRGALDSA